jgi:hypothetical protein
VYEEGKSASAVTREDLVEESGERLISIAGGKFTTARRGGAGRGSCRASPGPAAVRRLSDGDDAVGRRPAGAGRGGRGVGVPRGGVGLDAAQIGALSRC